MEKQQQHEFSVGSDSTGSFWPLYEILQNTT